MELADVPFIGDLKGKADKALNLRTDPKCLTETLDRMEELNRLLEHGIQKLINRWEL